MNLNDENGKSIDQEAYVTLTDTGHLLEVQYLSRRNTKCNILRLDADTYMNINTGEIGFYEKSENRADNLSSLRQTFKKLRYLVNNNFTGKPNELFVTFTFADQTRDTKLIYSKFDKFLKRLRYKYKEQSTIDFINVLEPHASGNFHAHMLLRFNELEKIYIPNDELRELWGNGWVTIKSLKDVDNIGAYVSAYLGDIQIPDDVQIPESNPDVVVKRVEGKDKRFLKGGRLQFYPPGMRLYRKSKGIEYPDRTLMTYEQAQKKAGSAQPHFRKTYEIERDDFRNTMIIEQYNLKRGKNDSE